MSMPGRRQSASQGRWRAIALGSAVTLIVLGVIGVLVGRAWIDSYLRSERFRHFVARKVGATLRAQGEFAPFHFAGSSFHSDAFTARGTTAAWFSELRLDQVRAEVSARRFFERVVQIDQATVERLDIRLEGTRVELDESAAPLAKPSSSRTSGWLPNRVEISSGAIREANLAWGTRAENSGTVRGTRLAIAPRGDAWRIDGHGGRIEHAALPPLDVASFNLQYTKPKDGAGQLTVESAELRQGASGSVSVTGEVRFGDGLDLRGRLSGIDVKPLLAEDWRARLHGRLGGEIDVVTRAGGKPVVTGKIELADGQIEALPVLDQIALFTRLQQYRRLALSKCSADFRHENNLLTVTNFVAESRGLIRVEGAFTIVDSTIDGVFQVGVAPSSLQWLPGSQERVFTTARDAYVWTPMRLTGPVRKPSEDLSPRLVAAAEGAIIEGATDAVRGTIKTGKDAVKSALDLLMPLVK